MLFYLTILLVFWALIYTSARFLRYFRIVKEYKDYATAIIIEVKPHVATGKKEEAAFDVVLEYDIGDRKNRSEIIVPASQAEQYEIGKELEICYHVADNGAVHIASAGTGAKKMMYAYLGAIILELVIYFIIWRILL